MEQGWSEGSLVEKTWEKGRGRVEGTWANETSEGSNRGSIWPEKGWMEQSPLESPSLEKTGVEESQTDLDGMMRS